MIRHQGVNLMMLLLISTKQLLHQIQDLSTLFIRTPAFNHNSKFSKIFKPKIKLLLNTMELSSLDWVPPYICHAHLQYSLQFSLTSSQGHKQQT